MKIHVWFQTFYVGNENISANPNHVVSKYPSWANVQKRNFMADKPVPSTAEHNGYFLDPANPDVQKYLLSLLSEMAANYDIDGINIDYIRYPASLPRNFPGYIESTWGYSNFARKEFESIYGVDPANLTQESDLWQSWVTYRQNAVTSFVSKLKPVIQNKNILISTVIFPDPEESAMGKLQNWKFWGNNSYVDAFTPLVMGSDESLVRDYVQEVKYSTENKITVYPGLFQPFTSGTPFDLLMQIKAARDVNASGIVIFDYAHLKDSFVNALNTRVFSDKE
jgi:uncharacterized lipoprotein YddW (UPF0748 family)